MITATDKSLSTEKLSSSAYRTYVQSLQGFAYWVFRAWSPLYTSKVVVNALPEDLSGRHVIIAANHQGHLDPFLMLAVMPPLLRRRLGMLRFFAHSFFFDNPIYRVFLLSFGCFPARLHSALPYGLPYAIKRLSQGDSIVIFPEGKMTRSPLPAKAGVSVLAQEPNAVILPIRLQYNRKHRAFLRLDVVVGKPFDAHEMTAQEILDRIYALPL